MKDLLLSFGTDGERLTVYANRAGLLRLKSVLERLLEAEDRGVNDDAHLLAESWGGYDLAEQPMPPSIVAMKQVDFRVLLQSTPPNNSLERSRAR